jgi:hypothetical protein
MPILRESLSMNREPSFVPRGMREIRDDQGGGPVVAERLLAVVTIAMLVVLVTSTLGQGILLLVLDVSARIGQH